MRVWTIYLSVFLWTGTAEASVIKTEESFMELVINPIDGQLQPHHQQKDDFEVVVEEEGESSDVFAKYQTDIIAKEEEEAGSEIAAQEEGEPLNEIDFYYAQFIDITSSNWISLQAEGDPLLKAGLFEGDIDLGNISDTLLFGRNALRGTSTQWPDAIVPYSISNAFSNEMRILIARAVFEFHKKTCIRFVPKTSTQKDYLYFVEGRGCSSPVGRVGGAQQVSLGKGCRLFGIVVHELMHALGFWHEQSRPDRDDYVTIVWNNVQTGMEFNFQKYSWNYIQALGQAYDYGSVMHYEAFAFARRRSKPTIVPKERGKAIGQRLCFSPTDLKKINALYRCDKDIGAEVGEVGMECADGDAKCAGWALQGQCDRNAGWMRPNCMKACGVCGLSAACADLNIKCAEWSETNQCNTNPGYMKLFCKKSCRVCSL